MMKLCLLSILVFGISFPLNSWQEFNSYQGRFSVLVPGPMVEKITTMETSLGDLEYHTFVHRPEEKDPENELYMVSYYDFPLHTMHSDSIDLLEEFFEATIESAVESLVGDLDYQSAISLRDYPGRIWRISYNNGSAIIKTKAFLVNRRFYTIQAATQRGKSLNPKLDQYLDSFRLLGRP